MQLYILLGTEKRGYYILENIKVQRGKISMNAIVYLNVPFAEKDEAKASGARWDSSNKKWYYKGNTRYLYKFKKWLPDADMLAYNEIYIIKGSRSCYHCHKPTVIVGIGISTHSNIYEESGQYIVEDYNLYPTGKDDEIHLAWFENEDDVPPYLLDYLKSNFNVKTVFSKTQNENCFANYCEHCNSIQGNYFLFSESSPLTTDCEGQQLIDRMKKLDIYTIKFDYALPLKIDITYCDNDWAYLEYCSCHYSDNEYVAYAEMYNLNKKA